MAEPLKRLAFSVAIVVLAAALRLWPLQALGTRTAWLTYYPAVTVAAAYGGFGAGLLAIALSCLVNVWLWSWLVPAPYIQDGADWLGLVVFCLNCVVISAVAEGMRRANARAQAALEVAEASNRAKSRFLAHMSHELRTPLNAILGFSGLLQSRGSFSGDERKMLDVINRSGEHLLRLINDVLDMAKVESGAVTVDNSPLDLAELLRDVAELMTLRAEEKGLSLLIDPASEFPRCVGVDGPKLRQVLLNLVGNAIKYTAEGQVTVRLHCGASESMALHLEVADTGAGIAAEEQAHIFEPFVQLGASAVQQGTGLGLAITRDFVTRMGGRIYVESQPGQGSTFHVEIPVTPAQPPQASLHGETLGRAVALAPGQPAWRVLVVDDQMENWLLLQHLLQEIGFEVQVALNGAQAVEAFQSWRPHFIWMDVRMPVMDGLEATRRIRALDGGREVKIAAVTASVFREERSHVLAAGMDDFVRKPYRVEEITDCMARHLSLSYLRERGGGEGRQQLSQEGLVALPEELRRALGEAVVELDAAKISQCVEAISAMNPELGKTLSHHASQLRYTALLHAVESVVAL